MHYMFHNIDCNDLFCVSSLLCFVCTVECDFPDPNINIMENQLQEKELEELKKERGGDMEDFPPHLKPGSDFSFRVTVLQAYGIPMEYADIFCQFK